MRRVRFRLPDVVVVAGIALSALLGACTAAKFTMPPAFAMPSVTPFAAASGSSCVAFAPVDTEAADSWMANVCPAVDRLVRLRPELDALVRAVDVWNPEEVVAHAAAASQQLDEVKRILGRAPAWAPGASILRDALNASQAYQQAVDDIRAGAINGDTKTLTKGKQGLTATHALLARIRAAMRGTPSSNSALGRYNEFVDHVKLAAKYAKTQRDHLRVTNNLAEIGGAVGDAEALANWGDQERQWLRDHPTHPCYTDLAGQYVKWVADPAYLLGQEYARYWKAGDSWNEVLGAVAAFDDGYRRWTAEIADPHETCTAASPSPKASPTR